MMRAMSVAMILATGMSVAYAQSGVVSQRQDAMKTLAKASGTPGAMLKEQQPFDLAKVQETLKIYQEQTTKLKELWPEASKTEDSASLPSVWDKRTEFLGRFDAFLAATTAAAAAIKDEASLKAEWPKVMQSCGGCHREYRKPS